MQKGDGSQLIIVAAAAPGDEALGIADLLPLRDLAVPQLLPARPLQGQRRQSSRRRRGRHVVSRGC